MYDLFKGTVSVYSRPDVTKNRNNDDVFCIFLGQEKVKGRPHAYILYGYCLQLGTGVLFLATSCLLYIDTVPLTHTNSSRAHLINSARYLWRTKFYTVQDLMKNVYVGMADLGWFPGFHGTPLSCTGLLNCIQRNLHSLRPWSSGLYTLKIEFSVNIYAVILSLLVGPRIYRLQRKTLAAS